MQNPNPSYNEILQLIESRYRYLISHKLFLENIARNQVSFEEISDYTNDIFNLRINPEKFVKSFLPFLQMTLLDRLDFFRELMRIAGNKNEQSIALLNLILDFEIKSSKVFSRIQSADIELQDKILFAFHEKTFLQMLQAEIQALLPANYQRLRKTVEFKEIQHKLAPIEAVPSKFSVNINIIFSWDYLKNDLWDDSRKQVIIPNDRKKKTVQNNPCTLERMPPELSQEFGRISALIEKIGTIKKSLTKNRKDNLTAIANHVEVFFAIDPYYLQLCDLVGSLKNKLDKIIDIKPKYQDFIKRETKKLNEISTYYNPAYNTYLHIRQKKGDDFVNRFLKREIFDSLKGKIGNIKKRLDIPIPQAINTPEKLEIYISETERYLQEVQLEVKQLQEVVLDCTKQLQQDELDNLKNLKPNEVIEKSKKEEEAVQQALILKKKEEQAHFFQNQKQKLSIFRAEVDQKREEKKVAQEKISPREEKKDLQEQSQVFINTSMEYKLKLLKSKHLSFLLDILEEKKGLKYKTIHSLITKHLGGRISEIGNGSSHKRIDLQSYITEMVTHSDVVGGMSRPHGKAHNSGELSKFNITLVKSVLLKAGITRVVVEALDKKLESTIVQNAVNPTLSSLCRK